MHARYPHSHQSSTIRLEALACDASMTFDALSYPAPFADFDRTMPRRIALRRSPIHGNGVFALTDIPKGTEIIEYRGRRMTHAQIDRVYANVTDNGHTFLKLHLLLEVNFANFEETTAGMIAPSYQKSQDEN